MKEEEELQLALALSQSEAEIKNKKASTYRMPSRKTSSPDAVNSVSPIAPSFRDSSPASISSGFDDRNTDPELAKYLNRDYWEQRGNQSATNSQVQTTDITNPTAPISTPQPSAYNTPPSFNVNLLFSLDYYFRSMQFDEEFINSIGVFEFCRTQMMMPKSSNLFRMLKLRWKFL